MDKIFNINLNGQTYEIQDRPLTEQVATLEGEVAGKLNTSAYTPYDDTQVKADIQANTTAIEGKQDKGNYALSGTSYTKAESDAKYLTEHQSLNDYAKTADVNAKLIKKQDTLVTGTNIKRLFSLNSRSLLGSGNIYIPTINGYDMLPPSPYNYYVKTINNQSVFGDTIGNIDVQPTLVSGTNIKTVNGSSLLGSGNLSVSVDELEADKVKFITKGEEVITQGEEITNGYNNEHVQYIIFMNDNPEGEGLTLSCDGGYSIHYSSFYKNVTFTNVEGTYEKYGEDEDDFIVKLNTAIPLNNVSISYDSAMSEICCHAYIATLEQEVKVETLPEVITNYYTKTEIDNMVGNINNALNEI